MPSRADTPQSRVATRTSADRDAARTRIEFGLRVVAFAAIAAALASVAGWFNGGVPADAPVVVRTAGTSASSPSLSSAINASLLDASADLSSNSASTRAVHLFASSVPSDTARALMNAARLAGVPVAWTDSTKRAAIAVEVQPHIDPRGGYTLRVAAPTGVSLELRDSLGLIDSVTTRSGGGGISVGRLSGSVRASVAASQAISIAPAAPDIRRVLVLADPGWEAKFTVAALEERGWNVDVRYAIGKNVSVTQGTPLAPDTARYSAVIALDSSARNSVAQIRRYVASGGGVVIAGSAATLREFGDLLPARAGARQPGVPGALETETPLVGIASRSLVPDSNAVVIERSARKGSPNPTVVARRYGAGRVVAVAYDGTWEWRMAGPEGSVEAHRQWWSTVVANVAFAPDAAPDSAGVPLDQRSDEPGSAAPLADAHFRLGPSSPLPAVAARTERGFPWELLFTLIAVTSLLGEWASRRLRGAR